MSSIDINMFNETTRGAVTSLDATTTPEERATKRNDLIHDYINRVIETAPSSNIPLRTVKQGIVALVRLTKPKVSTDDDPANDMMMTLTMIVRAEIMWVNRWGTREVPIVAPTAKWFIESLNKLPFDGSVTDQDICPICWQQMSGRDDNDDDVAAKVVTGLPCDHFYHYDCIFLWLQRSHLCPLCRFELPY